MASQKIHFFSEEIAFQPKQKVYLRKWVTATIKNENYSLTELNFIYCTDNYLLKINQDFLKHNTYTDVVTFDNSEKPNTIVGDIFISIERIRENAIAFHVSENDELHRVMIHGTLHLLGYKDKSKADKNLMTDKENQYLALRQFKV